MKDMAIQKDIFRYMQRKQVVAYIKRIQYSGVRKKKVDTTTIYKLKQMV